MNFSALSLTWASSTPEARTLEARTPEARTLEPAAQTRARISFAASSAGDLWRDRLPGLIEAALVTELDAVRVEMLESTRVWVPYQELADFLARLQQMGLTPTVLASAYDPMADPAGAQSGAESGPEIDPLEFIRYQLCITKAKGGISQAGGNAGVAPTCNIPACCEQAWSQASAAGCIDPLAALVEREKAGPLLPFAALAPLGISPLRHPPCSLHCEQSIAAVGNFIRRAENLGFVEAAEFLSTLGESEVAFSVRSGLAEVKTKGFRFAYRSDNAPGADGAPIVDRPKRWAILPALQKSPAVSPLTPQFASEFARRSRWNTVVWEQAPAIKRALGTIAHFGCGDGLLLELAGQLKSSITLMGIEAEPALANAALTRPVLSSSVVHTADWTALVESVPLRGEGIDVIFFDPEALIALPEKRRSRAVSLLIEAAGAVVAYATDRALNRYGDIECLGTAAGLDLVPGRRHRVSALLK